MAQKDILVMTEKDWLDWLMNEVPELVGDPIGLSKKYPVEYQRIIKVVGNWMMVESKFLRYGDGEYHPAEELPYGLTHEAKNEGPKQRNRPLNSTKITNEERVKAMFAELDEKIEAKNPARIIALMTQPPYLLRSLKASNVTGKNSERTVNEMWKEQKRPEGPPRPYEEVMAEVMNSCEESGRLLSERALKKSRWLNYDEIVAVLGKGNPRLAMSSIAQTWKKQHPEEDKQRKKEQVVIAPKEIVVANEGIEAERRENRSKEGLCEERTIMKPESIATQVEGAVEPVKRKRGKAKVWTQEKLIALLFEMQKELNLGDGLPTLGQIDDYRGEDSKRCPGAQTFLKTLGSKKGWKRLLDDASK